MIRRSNSSQRTKRNAKAKNQMSCGQDESLLLPLFLSRRAAQAVRGYIPRNYRKRMKFYYQDYGCLRCGLKDDPRQKNGLCLRCSDLIRERLKRSFFRHTRCKPSRYGREITGDAQAAIDLLKNLAHQKDPGLTKRTAKTTTHQNPALGIRRLLP